MLTFCPYCQTQQANEFCCCLMNHFRYLGGKVCVALIINCLLLSSTELSGNCVSPIFSGLQLHTGILTQIAWSKQAEQESGQIPKLHHHTSFQVTSFNDFTDLRRAESYKHVYNSVIMPFDVLRTHSWMCELPPLERTECEVMWKACLRCFSCDGLSRWWSTYLMIHSLRNHHHQLILDYSSPPRQGSG